MAQEFRSGFVAVVGRPNAGKSTIVNRLVGQKVAIVTSRPQTTRNRIQGIVNRPNAQVVLIDTPGLHRPDSALGRQMMGEVNAALDGVDVLTLILDVSEISGKGASLKKIGTEARKELEEILGTKIFLELFVKVLRDWRDNPQIVRQLDWHLQLERLGVAGE